MPPGTFSFSRAVRESAFIQLRLVDLGNFRKAATERGLSGFGPFDQDPWETLDREDILTPVAYARHGTWQYDQPGCLADGDLKVREETGFLPWAKLQEEAQEAQGKEYGTPCILYHHWQLLWLANLERTLTPQAPWGNLGEGFDRFFEARAQVAGPPPADFGLLDRLREQGQGWAATELLLVRVQNVFFPFERGAPRQSNWIGGPVPLVEEDAIDWCMQQFREFDAEAVAAECETDAEDLKSRYEQLVIAGMFKDPTKSMMDLLDQINRGRRERLTGDALLALDYYDAARMLRHWHARLTGDELPDIDEYSGINGTEYKLRRFGTTDVKGRRDILPILLEEYGLYPWRVQLICEGESELVALAHILEKLYGLSLAGLGISSLDMHGSEIPENAAQLLRSMLATIRGYANYFLLVFDNEGTTKELIEQLLRSETIEGLSDKQRKAITEQATAAISQITDAKERHRALGAALERAQSEQLTAAPGSAPEFVLWRENLEADSFTPAELGAVITKVAQDEMGLQDFELAGGELEEQLRQDGKKGIASVALDLAAKKDERFNLAKPAFARALAQYAIENPENPYGDSQRPLLELAGHLVQLTWADRRLQGQLRQDRR